MEKVQYTQVSLHSTHLFTNLLFVMIRGVVLFPDIGQCIESDSCSGLDVRSFH